MKLSQPASSMKPRYDVIGSGYGGGVTASRLARAGKRVAVLERGREFQTGEFPSRFPDLRSQMQVSGASVRIGPSTGHLVRAPIITKRSIALLKATLMRLGRIMNP